MLITDDANGARPRVYPSGKIAAPSPSEIKNESKHNASREARKKKLRDTAYATLVSAKKIPHSLEGLDSMIGQLFSHMECLKAGDTLNNWNADPFHAPRYSPASHAERKRIGKIITEATEKSGLELSEAHSAVNAALCEISDRYPGY